MAHGSLSATAANTRVRAYGSRLQDTERVSSLPEPVLAYGDRCPGREIRFKLFTIKLAIQRGETFIQRFPLF